MRIALCQTDSFRCAVTEDESCIKNGIEEYTYKQTYERTREFVRMEIQSQKEAGNTDFMDITDEYINNATPEELDALYIKVMQTVGFER